MSKKKQQYFIVPSENEEKEQERRDEAVQQLAVVDDDYAKYLSSIPAAKKKRIDASLRNLRTGLHTVAPLHCMEFDAPVTMSDGTHKAIGKINIGEQIIDRLGNPVKVTYTMNREYRGAMFRFKFGPGQGKRWTSWMTADHRLLVNGEWVHAADIKKGDLFERPPAEGFSEISQEDHAEAVLLGYYLAEGCSRPDNKYKGKNYGSYTSFAFHRKEVPYADQITEACRVLGYNKPRYYFKKEAKTLVVHVSGRKITKWLIKQGGRLSHEKILSEAVMNWPLEKLRIMLLCYVNGDGCWKEERHNGKRKKSAEASWITTSQRMCEQLFTIAWRLGLNPSLVRAWKRLPNRKPTYWCYISGPSCERLRTGQASTSPEVQVSAIETKYAHTQVYDIETETHSFVHQGIISHNCKGPAACPFIQQCPIPERGPGGNIIPGPDSNYPMYRSCIYERFYMQQKVIDYVQHLKVDPDNPIEMAIVNDLAIIDLYKNRAMLVLGGGDSEEQGRDFLKVDVKQAQGEHGIILEKKTQLHPAADYIEKLEKRRDRLIAGLQESRKSQSDLRIKLGNTNTETKLLEEIRQVRGMLDQMDSIPLIKEEDPLLIDD